MNGQTEQAQRNHLSRFTREVPAIKVTPHHLRRNHGNPAICSFCPRCDERTITARDGRCMWCSALTMEIL